MTAGDARDSAMDETARMNQRQFCYPRVEPAVPKAAPPGAASSEVASRETSAQRDLVAASLVRCPPRDGDRRDRG